MILAIDTATRWLGLALHDGRYVVAEVGWRSVNTQTEELAPAIAELMNRSTCRPADLEAIAVAIGPGSYTGLRIGLGFAKGLALANSISLIGVPTLDIVAAAQPEMEGRLMIVAEAGRTRICVAGYQWHKRHGWQAEEQPVIDTWDNLLERVSGPAYFAGEINVAAAKRIRTSPKKLRLLSPAASARRAGFLAEIGWQRLRRGQADKPDTLAPIYLRDP